MKKNLFFCFCILLLNSCTPKENSKLAINQAVKKARDSAELPQASDTLISKKSAQKSENTANVDEGKVWLQNIFKNNYSDHHFPEFNVEEKLCTKRFRDFIYDANDIYGPSNLTEDELPAAKKAYEKKWAKIYPLYTEECFLFGRGNGDTGELKELKIEKISDLKYSVFINYNGDIKTQNEVTLVPENGSYKIDYCKTDFL